MKKALLFLILLATPFLGTASHIVGGEFELVHISGFLYKLNMVIYFDEVNGSQAAKDLGGEDVRVFRMVDNVVMMNIHVPYVSISKVNYTQPACSSDQLVTSKILYSTTITLPSASFNDPKGYYIAWERCCRNYGITNIFSQNANTDWAGQTFYLQFPPVMKDGTQFVDSTPRLFPPLSDYACVLKPYYANFGGIDDDGDSLVYSLTTPLTTGTNDPVPPITPRPYPEIRWRSPFALTNIMNGAPDLTISHDGLLRVTPTLLGLFVFAVKVEEFRNKIKIGETRRDFQMLVLDCPVAVPPVIVGRKKGTTTYQANTLFADFTGVTSDADRCIEVQISDDDSKDPKQGYQENITIKVVALNFKKDISGVLPAVTTATLTNGSLANFTICFADCPFTTGDAIIGIIAMDDACSLPLMDTLKVTLRIPPPPNTKPHFILPTPNPFNASLSSGNEFFAATINQGSQLVAPFEVVDDESDPIVLTVVTDGFVLSDAGMTVTNSAQVGNHVDGQLTWDAYCQLYNFTNRLNFQVTILAEDQDKCLIANPARAVHKLTFNPPPDASPTIDTDLTPATHERTVTGITRRINEPLVFRVTAKEADGNLIVLKGAAKDFSLANYGISINPVTAIGTNVITSDFQWNIACTSVDLSKKNTFDFRFIVVDSVNLCHFYKSDTVDIQMKVLPPVNQPPLLTITNQNSPATQLYNNGINMILGPTIKLLLTGTDADVFPAKDNLKIALVSATGSVKPEGYTFTPVTGTSPIQTSLIWQPDCTIFKDNVYENEYEFLFTIADDHCLTAKTDSVTVKLKVKDVDGSDSEFIPPNFFSPNGDGVNDYFAMELKDNVTGEIKNILPNDNCYSHFEAVRIYNRWGNQVFQSPDRDFKWDAIGESAGVYFYFLKYTRKEYRGTVSLRY